MGLLGSILSAISPGDDGGCDWYCDECDAYLNDQPGFTVAGGTWICAECGCPNNVSEDNVIDDDDGYVGSYQYYQDEEKRRREEDEELWELGIDPDD